MDTLTRIAELLKKREEAMGISDGKRVLGRDSKCKGFDTGNVWQV